MAEPNSTSVDVRPQHAPSDLADMGLAKAKAVCDFLLSKTPASVALANLANLCFAQPRVRMRFAEQSRRPFVGLPQDLMSVKLVLPWRRVFDVFDSIVMLMPISVIDLTACRAFADKRSRNEPVHKLLRAIARRATQVNLQVARPVALRLNDARRLASESWFAPNPAKR